MQITIGTTDGQTFQTDIEETSQLVGKEIGDEFDGGIIGLSGYTLKVTGGSDKSGIPMRKSIEGSERKRVMIGDGQGINEDEDGVRRRKSVRGKRISNEIQQLNTTVVEKGGKSVEELLTEDEEE
jgi:small subunit ribosomal protein S6e